MDTATFSPEFTRTGQGRISLVFGEFSQNVAHVILTDGRTIHLHGHPGWQDLSRLFGGLPRAVGRRISFTTDVLGVALTVEAKL